MRFDPASTARSAAILSDLAQMDPIAHNRDDGNRCYDVPFAYTPFWDAVRRRAEETQP